MMTNLWSIRADEAARSVKKRYLNPSRQFLRYPSATWPTKFALKTLVQVDHYWWCAHFIDCVVDESIRTGNSQERKLAKRLIISLYIRNRFTVVNNYYDDMAWLALAVQRAKKFLNIGIPRILPVLSHQLYSAWCPQYGGGIRWRKTDFFFNAPAAGPTGIFTSRSGNITRAEEISTWVYENLFDPVRGLVFDGIHADVHLDGTWELTNLETAIYTYNQGTIAGLEWSLAQVDLDSGSKHQRIELVHQIITAVQRELCTDGKVIRGHGAGDGGLFSGILARYLAEIACTADRDDPQQKAVAILAENIVLSSAEAAYSGALKDNVGLIFNDEWSLPATVNTSRDLSVQVGAWMLLEAAARIQKA